MNKKMLLFPFPDIFNCCRGKRLIEENQISGDIAYISSTKRNNGISAFINPPDFMERYKNLITLSNSGSVGYCFYHDYEFVASDHVTVIELKNKNITLNKNIALFLKPIFESMRYKYNFGREISNERLNNEKILLPINDNQNPDWIYMNDYISDIIPDISFKRIVTNNKLIIDLNMDNWKEFSLKELFPIIESCKCSKASDLIEGNDVYYLGAKKNDSCVIKKVTSVPELLTKGNCMAFICDGDGSVGYSNYINFDQFIGTTNLAVGYNNKLNKYNGLFLVAILDLQRSKYSFGRKYKKRLPDTKIKLPVLSDGNPDWSFMEKNIKLLPYSNYL